MSYHSPHIAGLSPQQGASPLQQHRPMQPQAAGHAQAQQQQQQQQQQVHSNHLPAEHAVAIQTTLQQIEAKLTACAAKIDHSLQTPYAPTDARADYHAMLALLQQLEHQSPPISSIGYSPATLASFQSHPPPSFQTSPNEVCARFVTELGEMNKQLKGDAQALQGTVQQQGVQAKLAAKEYKSGMQRMMSGAVAPVHQAEAAQQAQLPTAAVTPQAMHLAQMAYVQAQQRHAAQQR
jgi:hypothetical protein